MNAFADFLFLKGLTRYKAENGYSKELWKLARHLSKNPKDHPEYSLFMSIVGKRNFSAGIFEKIKRKYMDAELSSDIFMKKHTWIGASKMAVYSIFLDWMAQSGVISKDAITREGNFILKQYRRFVFPALLGRTPETNFNTGLELSNQVCAMTFGCSIAGYLWGEKYSADEFAKDMLDYARNIFPVLIGRSVDGFGGEGHTYQFEVEIPSLVLMAKFWEDILGIDFFFGSYYPCNTSLKQIIDNSYEILIDPSGTPYPVRDYGYGRVESTLGLSYAFSKTGNSKYLSLMERTDWKKPAKSLWTDAIKIFDLIFISRKTLSHKKPETGSYLMKYSCCRLANKDASLLQSWFFTNRLPHTHWHVDTNSIVLHRNGAPMVVEGIKSDRDKCKFYSHKYYFFPGDYRDMGEWAVGAHNTLIVNDDEQYSPATAVRGEAKDFRITPRLELISSEGGGAYRNKYEIKTFLRTSFFLESKFFIISDKVESGKKYDYKFRFHFRGNAVHSDRKTLFNTEENESLLVCPAGNYKRAINEIEYYPNVSPYKCTRIDYTFNGKKASHKILLYSYSGTQNNANFNFSSLSNMASKIEINEDEYVFVDGNDTLKEITANSVSSDCRHGLFKISPSPEFSVIDCCKIETDSIGFVSKFPVDAGFRKNELWIGNYYYQNEITFRNHGETINLKFGEDLKISRNLENKYKLLICTAKKDCVEPGLKYKYDANKMLYEIILS